jgi:hypothetical protein
MPARRRTFDTAYLSRPPPSHRPPLTLHPDTMHYCKLDFYGNHALGLRAEGVGLRAEGLGLRVEGLELRAEALGRRVEGSRAHLQIYPRTRPVRQLA